MSKKVEYKPAWIAEAEEREEHDSQWQQAENGYWYHPSIEGAWYRNHENQWRRYVPPSNAPKVIVLILGCCLGLGGCAAIAIHPVMALALFFVGIPFLLFVAWMTGVFASAVDRR